MAETIPVGIPKRKSRYPNGYPPVIYRKVNNGLNRGMPENNIATIRRQNLKVLASACGSAARLAELIDRPPALVNNYLSERRQKVMGERFARHVEDSLKLDRGAMDRVHEEPWSARDLVPARSLRVSEPDPANVRGGVILLEQLDVRAAMSPPGSAMAIPVPEVESVIDLIRVPLNYVRERFPHISSPRNLKIITGFGDSMKPTFSHGDPLIVDTGVRAMDVDTIYVFTYSGELFIKRIQRMPDRSIKVISDNRAVYDPYPIDADQRKEVTVLARVVCAVNMNMIS